jgi:hypothetical protein
MGGSTLRVERPFCLDHLDHPGGGDGAMGEDAGDGDDAEALTNDHSTCGQEPVSGIRLWAEATGRLMTGMALVSPHELLTYKVNSLGQCIMPVDHRSSSADQRTRVRVQ